MNKFRAKLRYFLQIRKKKCNFAAKLLKKLENG